MSDDDDRRMRRPDRAAGKAETMDEAPSAGTVGKASLAERQVVGPSMQKTPEHYVQSWLGAVARARDNLSLLADANSKRDARGSRKYGELVRQEVEYTSGLLRNASSSHPELRMAAQDPKLIAAIDSLRKDAAPHIAAAFIPKRWSTPDEERAAETAWLARSAPQASSAGGTAANSNTSAADVWLGKSSSHAPSADASASTSNAGAGATATESRASEACASPMLQPAPSIVPPIFGELASMWGLDDEKKSAPRDPWAATSKESEPVCREGQGAELVDASTAIARDIGTSLGRVVDAFTEPAPSLRDDQCQVDGPRSPEAITGIQLYLTAKDSIRRVATQTRDYRTVGPGQAGPYRLYAHTKENKLVYYLAWHTERQQNEWVIGPESADAFAGSVDLYVGAARASLPGSKKVKGSQADGADKAPHMPSMLELEHSGDAPHQQQIDPFTFNPLKGVDAANGGNSLVAARNAHVRLEGYTKEAKRLAVELKTKLDAGEIGHLDARTQAVDGRNDLMRATRENLSPSAREASKKLKSDQGISLDEMTSRKTEDILRASEPGGKGMRVLGLEGDDEALRKVLEKDSALWAKYREAMRSGNDVKRVFSAAVQDLGAQPVVSRAIVNSAAKSNSQITGLAKTTRAAAGAAGVYGLYDMVTTIADAKEGELLHVAAGELGGFAGGIIGSELGTIWLASLIQFGAGAPVVIVVTLIGGLFGASIGGQLGRMVGQVAPEVLALPIKGAGYPMAPGAAQGGGYAGLHERSVRQGMKPTGLRTKLADSIFALDETLGQIEKKIENAESRDKLEQLQRMRLDVLDQRDQVGEIYSALQAGLVTEDEVQAATGDQN